MNAEQNAWEEFRKWRERYIKRANAVKTKSPEEELDDALARLDKGKARHEIMVAINKILRKKIADEEKVTLMIKTLDIPEKNARYFFSPECGSGQGYPPYSLTNHNARIKSLEEKVLTMKARILVKANFSEISFPGGKIDIENDRVVVYHDEKPEAVVIQALKSRGFRWSPKFRCWCRKHTARALHDAKEVCGL
jgi:hypothetical protein